MNNSYSNKSTRWNGNRKCLGARSWHLSIRLKRTFKSSSNEPEFVLRDSGATFLAKPLRSPMSARSRICLFWRSLSRLPWRGFGILPSFTWDWNHLYSLLSPLHLIGQDSIIRRGLSQKINTGDVHRITVR